MILGQKLGDNSSWWMMNRATACTVAQSDRWERVIVVGGGAMNGTACTVAQSDRWERVIVVGGRAMNGTAG